MIICPPWYLLIANCVHIKLWVALNDDWRDYFHHIYFKSVYIPVPFSDWSGVHFRGLPGFLFLLPLLAGLWFSFLLVFSESEIMMMSNILYQTRLLYNMNTTQILFLTQHQNLYLMAVNCNQFFLLLWPVPSNNGIK